MFEYSTYDLDGNLIKRGRPHNIDNFTGIIFRHNTNKMSHFKNGKLHRLYGPAVEWLGGTKEWWFEGKIHRVGGPAIESYNGFEDWYVDGKEVTKEQHDLLTDIMKLKALI